ncbi:hypothetical protein WJX84_009993 [Apatococcus fuscideae]|uniref:UBX domain-containing protein n=1 Tax=Apatococcus fuscideae TaxID=2026836 RepID=A0AAW1SN47_9CHLO
MVTPCQGTTAMDTVNQMTAAAADATPHWLPDGATHPASPKAPVSEDDELAAAIAASLKQSKEVPGRSGTPGAGTSQDALPASPAAQTAPHFSATATQEPTAAVAADSSHPQMLQSGHKDGASMTAANGASMSAANGASMSAANGAATSTFGAPPAQNVLEEAQKALPPEPSANEAECRIGVRLPDGKRVTRRFSPDHSLAAVAAFCVTLEPEAAGGRPFVLAKSGIGSGTYSDLNETIAAAGAQNVMMHMRWSE